MAKDYGTIYQDEKRRKMKSDQSLENFCDKHNITVDPLNGLFFFSIRGKFYCVATKSQFNPDRLNGVLLIRADLSRLRNIYFYLLDGLEVDDEGHAIHTAGLKFDRSGRLIKSKKKKHHKRKHSM